MSTSAPSRLQCLEGGWLFPGYVTLMKPRGVFQRFRERNMEIARKSEIQICSTTLNRVFINPTFGLADVVESYIRGEANNATLEKAFFGSPRHCFDWFRLGQAGITLGNDAARANDTDFWIGCEAVAGITMRAGLTSSEWSEVRDRFDAIRAAAKNREPFLHLATHLNGASAKLMSIAKRHDLNEAHAKEQKIVNIKVDFGSGNSFTGPVAVGETIQQTYAMAKSAATADLREKLEDLTRVTARLIESLPNDDEKIGVSDALKNVVETANKPSVTSSQLRISSAGLIEAAKTVTEMMGPISTAVAAVVALFK